MLNSTVVRTADFCTRHPWSVVVFAALLATASAIYAGTHFAITTNIERLIAENLPWHQRQTAYDMAFPQREILVVVEAPTPELVQQAADKLAERLSVPTEHIRAIRRTGSGPFFDHNALLFLSTEDVTRTTHDLTEAEPILATLSGDPSLRGVLDVLSAVLTNVQGGELKLDDLARPLTLAADTLDDVFAGRFTSFSWRVLAQGHAAEPRDLRRFIGVDPILDFTALEPGAAASSTIRRAAEDLKLASEFHATIRLTGSVPIADQEFGTVREGAFVNTAVTIVTVLVILWLALRSARIMFAVFLSLIVGLAATAALGLAMVGALNLISIAFAVLFVGLGVDFGIQFSVRYRSERHDDDNLQSALHSAAQKAGGPLALAAAATAAGFMSFLPTDYRGLSDLGQIAGCGMLIAFITSITVLPALLKIFNPPGEPHPLGFAALAPVDRFLERNRVRVLISTVVVVALGSPLLLFLHFDFNPTNLRDPNSESIATYLDLKKDPETGANAIEILAPTLDAANAIAERVSALPEVSRALTLKRFVPDGQEQKLDLIRHAASELDAALNPRELESPPTDAQVTQSLTATADQLTKTAGDNQGPGAAAARRLSQALTKLAKADRTTRAGAEQAFLPTLKITLDQLRNWLQPEPVSADTVPEDIKRDWVATDGRARVEVLPKGDPTDNTTLRNFATAVLAVEPSATGAAVSYLESGRTIVRAFVEAGLCALLVIAALLWIALRRLSDVLLTLVPLIIAGVVTLEICVIIGQPLNFANIIALPLLLGVGVAFKIYYIMAWRAGKTALLQSTLTRAVVFSAMTTATAFGSLWLSNHPGTSSMGKLMALSLVCTMAAAVLFQPVLMGPPRVAGSDPKSDR